MEYDDQAGPLGLFIHSVSRQFPCKCLATLVSWGTYHRLRHYLSPTPRKGMQAPGGKMKDDPLCPATLVSWSTRGPDGFDHLHYLSPLLLGRPNHGLPEKRCTQSKPPIYPAYSRLVKSTSNEVNS